MYGWVNNFCWIIPTFFHTWSQDVKQNVLWLYFYFQLFILLTDIYSKLFGK